MHRGIPDIEQKTFAGRAGVQNRFVDGDRMGCFFLRVFADSKRPVDRSFLSRRPFLGDQKQFLIVPTCAQLLDEGCIERNGIAPIRLSVTGDLLFRDRIGNLTVFALPFDDETVRHPRQAQERRQIENHGSGCIIRIFHLFFLLGSQEDRADQIFRDGIGLPVQETNREQVYFKRFFSHFVERNRIQSERPVSGRTLETDPE